jgi:hypothetical protein
VLLGRELRVINSRTSLKCRHLAKPLVPVLLVDEQTGEVSMVMELAVGGTVLDACSSKRISELAAHYLLVGTPARQRTLGATVHTHVCLHVLCAPMCGRTLWLCVCVCVCVCVCACVCV